MVSSFIQLPFAPRRSGISHWGISRRWFAAAALFVLTACSAVYPEVKSPVRSPAAGWTPDPAPPQDVIYLDFVGARIPRHTRDGRSWSSAGSKGPDAFAKVVVNGRDLLVTPVESGSLQPTWPGQRRANYRISAGSEVRVELWDAKTIQDRPICLKQLSDIHEIVSPDPVELVCEDTGARIVLNVLPGRPLLGLGLYYELMGEGRVRVTRVVEESPAARSGIVGGTEILLLQGRSVQEMDALDVKSVINAHSRTGVALELLFPDGKRRGVTLKEEAMYPLVTEDLALAP